MDQIAYRSYLYDFYGPLLTNKQSRIWDRYYQEDYSLAEIADEEKTSRQAVHDLLKRTEKVLLGYEEKLGLIKRFCQEKESLAQVVLLLAENQRSDFASEAAWQRQQKVREKVGQIIRRLADEEE